MAITRIDLLNDCEKYLKNWLSGDSSVEAGLVHVKLKADIRNYTQAQLPAIGVNSTGFVKYDDHYLISGIFEVTHVQGNFEKCSEKVKEIANQIDVSLDKDFVGTSGNRGKYFSDMGVVRVETMNLPLDTGLYCQSLVYWELKWVWIR